MPMRLKLKQDPAIKVRTIEYIWTGRWANWLTNKMGFSICGNTLWLPFLNIINYFSNEKLTAHDLQLIRIHESVHCEQRDRYGLIGVWARYLWQDVVQFCKYRSISETYYHNSIELEAYTLQSQINLGQLPLPEWAE